MGKIPAPFWAIILAAMGTGLTVAVLYHPTPENIGLAVLTVASNLVSGALGAFAGHSQATSEMMTNNKGPVTINPIDPAK